MKRLILACVALITLLLTFAHWYVPSKVAATMNAVLPHEPWQISERTRQLHASLFIVDLHADSLLWPRDLAKRSAIGHVDLPRLRDGNVALQVFSATTRSPSGLNYEHNSADSDQITLLAIAALWPPRTWFSVYERAVYQLDRLQELAGRTDLVVITDRADLERLVDARRRGERTIGALYLIEGAHPLEGDIGKLDALYAHGLRIVGLTHFFDNEVGGSLHGNSGAGLSKFGEAVIRRANELDLIIDVAHASPAVAAEVLQLSTKPVILSHGGLKGICDTSRNLPDDLMKALAERGGLIGIGYWDSAVCDASPAGIVRSIRYAIELLGPEHVALGSDFDGTVTTPFDAGELAILTETMLKSGFTEDEIRGVMGGNALRFLRDNLPQG